MIKLDDFDLRLLGALQDNARLTNNEVGDRIGLSPSQCSRRRSLLEAEGIIRSYRAELSASAVGLGLLVFMEVRLRKHSNDNAARFREFITQRAEVQEAYAVTGKSDYLLKIVLADLESLSVFVNTVLLRHESVARVRSTLVMERLKETTQLPLRSLPRQVVA